MRCLFVDGPRHGEIDALPDSAFRLGWEVATRGGRVRYTRRGLLKSEVGEFHVFATYHVTTDLEVQMSLAMARRNLGV